MKPEKQQVVVIGGGYAGALAAVRLAGRARKLADVTLIEPRAALVQRMRLHQLAAGQQVRSYDLAELTGGGVAIIRGRACSIDLERSRVVASGAVEKTVPFDYAIIATGSTVEATSIPGLAEYAHFLSGPDTAARLQERVDQLPPGAVMAVCGAGMTGIEAATEFAEARPDLKVKLITSRSLGDWLSEVGRRRLADSLRRLGIEVIDRRRVGAVEEGRVVLDGGASVDVDVTLWCGGFTGTPLARDSGLPANDRGGLIVDETLRVPGVPNILGAGDAAAIPDMPNGAAFRMSCQAGMPAGAHAADTVVAMLKGRDAEAFDFGYVHQPISIGRRDALIQWVDRADRPEDSVMSGRKAAFYKNLVTAGAVPYIRLQRRLRGAVRSPSAGKPQSSPECRSERAR